MLNRFPFALVFVHRRDLIILTKGIFVRNSILKYCIFRRIFQMQITVVKSFTTISLPWTFYVDLWRMFFIRSRSWNVYFMRAVVGCSKIYISCTGWFIWLELILIGWCIWPWILWNERLIIVWKSPIDLVGKMRVDNEIQLNFGIARWVESPWWHFIERCCFFFSLFHRQYLQVGMHL